MRYGSLVAAAMAAVIGTCLAASTACAQPKLYGDLRGGVAETPTMRFAQPTTANLALNPQRAWVMVGRLGAFLSGGYRVEAIASYQRGSISGAFNENVLPVVACGAASGQPCLDRGVTGTLKVPSLMAMGHYDMPLAPALALSLGAGVGIVWMDLNARTTARTPNGAASRFNLINDTDQVFAGRAEASLIYGRGPIRFLVGYSYTRTTPVSLRGRGIHTSFNFSPSLESHQLMGGVRFRF